MTDYGVNARTKLQIELLHQKPEILRRIEVSESIQSIRRLEARLLQWAVNGDEGGSIRQT
jgi:ABC-type lipopolysaccharide export system ATPase subunit